MIYLEKLRECGKIGKCTLVTAGWQADYSKREMKPVEKDGHTFYFRKEGGAIVCGYYVFPYLNDEELLDRLVTGEKLSDGFSLK